MKVIMSFGCLFLFSTCEPSQFTDHSEDLLWEHEAYPGGLTMITNDSLLAARFGWATSQALEYAHDENDPAGKWYEAALPDREAFCMRDVSHQSQGAHYLGLKDHTKNMLFKFAENIAESRDWCSYWEINRYNQPAPVDYANDNEFWYNLPANFDVLIACFRQYQLTGDSDYLNHPVFVNFYNRTMRDYILAWDLDIASVMNRNRFMNLRSPLDSTSSFQVSRGLPSYGEGDPLRLYLGADLLCLEYKAYIVYEKILRIRGLNDQADSVGEVSTTMKDWYNLHWWDQEENIPYSALLTDGSYNKNPSRYMLQSTILNTSQRRQVVLDGLLDIDGINIESQSYLPQLFYNFDQNQRAFKELLDLSHPEKNRNEYPEVSYACIESMVEGLMGLSIDAHQRTLKTISRLDHQTDFLEFSSLPMLEGTISLSHRNNQESILSSYLDHDIVWMAGFYGTYDSLWTSDGPVKANVEVNQTGSEISWVQLNVSAAEIVTVRVIENSEI